ncbi:PD-(D/E)XK nuclease family protein [Sporosarcina soli]|uniref:PD-(D/E)XK nuclease family protein n=1 Tax=Sporosarcina soli TaxID=334736 RepID=A0ABW0TR17_9BACL
MENKFLSNESEGQLEEYIEFVRTEYEGYKIIPVFLTLQDEEPTHEDYLMLGYSDVLDILKNVTPT